jgi:hypothetical protein
MKSQLVRSFVTLLLSAAAVTLTACGAPGHNNHYAATRAVDPFPFHRFDNHCGHSGSHCSH